ncbi:Putative metallo-beta-lactamase, ribonuclease Z/Hydroxyacylglutathione hydrolase [Septoria linicola]|uniref:Metallo-beta-lactamase, ribonuclease Z/Hydroxyacylglutathione hydrolase n=1 Tax=Septoria linicola TaxID=215465 RepID=A0A9Q9EDH8_9PEZI|nr:putative metallo-beta-lactamase, ribonuclease Z/Hydroxyacylglutathione hydrolase [Septoria linicola]USW47791.1 Putative metallo-beta-lactamase, ribonuclease Z/Hydroxyacylglutathione hydrolase [Septoria linicola]
MFRKPRESVSVEVGRPPSPKGAAKTPFSLAVPPSVPPPKMATRVKSSRQVPLPTIGRQGPSSTAKKTATPKNKIGGKGNGSILNFFKKSDDGGPAEPGLFVEDRRPSSPADPSVNELVDAGDDTRFNESSGSVKRRNLSADDGQESVNNGSTAPPTRTAKSSPKRAGPFYEESDSEQEEEAPEAVIGIEQEPYGGIVAGKMPHHAEASEESAAPEVADRPPLIKEETSYDPGMDEFEAFGDDDFDEDQFEGGDEFRERRYMEEQARLEAEDNEKDYDPLPDDANIKREATAEIYVPTCPICSVNLGAVSEQDAGVHVNNCLDGKPTPLPVRIETQQSSDTKAPIKTEDSSSVNQYRRPARPARPGQANPFTLGGSAAKPDGGSAFNKLMSGHTEEAAWAEAAASEHAARGKPSYQRTCPFYKILPGLFICVDAFRYGAVQGCQAYFLSHFHSDHYVGLTSTWTHGPIYCSKVTANLVKQQLRVDPRYVIPLEFEDRVDVPGTRGVKVTMISANHCPGSSLYLFEKTVGIKQTGEPRVQRILHCGDFRACRMHVEHPLLMPEVMDKVSGKTKEQKIDVCYLDTTYLNPRYAFPSQEDVIKACADMCVCLSKDTADEDDGWETMKRQRAGQGMVKFIQRETSNLEANDEPDGEATADNMTVEKNPHASQQILSSIKDKKTRGRLLVVVGTYSIGKERICMGIARALDAKIYAPPSKQRIIAALEDSELNARMTNDPKEAQVHMTPLFEIRAETLDDYLKDFWPHFTRAVGFRPSGWSYKPPNSRFTESPLVSTVLYSENWKSTYSMRELEPQRGSSSRASCFGVPYSEHSSFRELTMFCCALRIDKIIPTVNVGSAKSRDRMKTFIERWQAERRKNGLYKLPEDGTW